MKLKELINVIPNGQMVLVRNYDDESEVLFDDDNEYLVENDYNEIMNLEVKFCASENDCVREDYIIIEVQYE